MLIVQTRFSAYSFWNYQSVCKMVGAKYPAAPLGLLTIAALLPQHWIFKLVDMNVEPLLEEHLEWADLVCTGGMLPQQKSMLDFIKRAHKKNCIIAVEGADPTSQPELYQEADYLILGEGKVTIPMFLRDLQKGIRKGIYVSDEKADMLKAVIPRYDLIRFKDYILMEVQFIRGSPYGCAFCDIIELFGRTPRFKSTVQIVDELQTLYDLGYRDHIDFVDDNFIGNKKKVKELLHTIKDWSIKHNYPFYFTTEASVNLAEDDELLQLMKEVDFRYVFLGIETPENETLALNHKNQSSDNLDDSDVDQSTSGLNFITLKPRNEIIRDFVKVLDYIYKPENYYQRIIYTGISLKPQYKHIPSLRVWLKYLNSFRKVCCRAGFNRSTGYLYWKRFFTILLKNPKALEAAVNLAAMYIHFKEQKDYVVAKMKNQIKTGLNDRCFLIFK